jgi:hypothetical protein
MNVAEGVVVRGPKYMHPPCRVGVEKKPYANNAMPQNQKKQVFATALRLSPCWYPICTWVFDCLFCPLNEEREVVPWVLQRLNDSRNSTLLGDLLARSPGKVP